MKCIRSYFLLGMVWVACASAIAAPGPAPGGNLPAEVVACLRADGLLDLAALRARGYRGDVNFRGVRLAPGSSPSADDPATAPGKAAGDELWMGDFPIRTPETVEDLCSWNGRLVVASEREVYRWTGAAWQPLGLRANGAVHCAIAHGGDLVVGGDFTVAGGVAANRLARFDGVRWYPVGLGFDDRVAVLGAYGAQLVAAGDFRLAGSVSALRIAVWDGSAWAPLAGGLGAGVTAMAAFGDRLVVAGSFSSVGSVIVNHVAAWDGSTWSALGNGLNGEAWALAEHDGRLVAAGPFTTAGVAPVDGVAAWDGGAWGPFGDPQAGAQHSYHLCENAGVLSLAMHDDSFVRVLRWDGSAWQQIVFDTGLRALGLCSVAGQAAAAMSSRERTWIHLTNGQTSVILEGLGFDGAVLASTMWNGSLVVAGTFSHIGNLAATGIARWDGANWHALGDGLSYANEDHGIRALAVHDGELVAGGNFQQIGGVAATHVARWNGSAWAPLGTAYSDGGPQTGVLCLASYGGDLYAGGDFRWRLPGSGPVSTYVRWQGGAWSRSGPADWSGAVRSLCVFGGSLAIGGCPWSGCTAITLFDGEQYLSLPGANWDEPRLMREYRNRLYVAGAGGEVRSWDGYIWRDVLDRDDTVSLAAMEAYGDRLILGGRFEQITGTMARNIVAWDGTGWERLGSGVGRAGVEEGVRTMAVTPWGLAVGGDFWQAGGREFRSLARWNEAVATDALTLIPAAADRLAQNVPNPFNPSTTISFGLRASGPVDLRVYDLRGALVRTLVADPLEAGRHECRWNGLSDEGRPAPSGVYLFRLRTSDGVLSRTMTLLR